MKKKIVAMTLAGIFACVAFSACDLHLGDVTGDNKGKPHVHTFAEEKANIR